MLSSGMQCYHLELMLSSGMKCYHLGCNVIIRGKMLSCEANVVMLSFGANVIIWCYHVMLSSGMITSPYFIFSENFTHSWICQKIAARSKYEGGSPKFICALCHVMYTAVLIGWDPCTIPPIPRIGTRIRGRYWSAKIDDISPGQALWSFRECGMDNPFQLKSHQAGSPSSSQPWWVISLACGLIVYDSYPAVRWEGGGDAYINTQSYRLNRKTRNRQG